MAKRGRPKKQKPVGLDGEPLKEKKPDTAVRAEEQGFTAGLPVNLDRVMRDGRTLRENLSDSVGKWLSQELENQQPRIDKLAVWDRLYRGIKPDKNTPYPGCHNTAIPKTRSLTDALAVRIVDAIFGQIKVWIVKPQTPDFVEIAPELEDGLDWWQRHIVKFRKKIFSPLLQCIKTGTGIVKLDYSKQKRVAYRYADADEEGPDVYKTKKGQKVFKSVKSAYDGPTIKPISREDFVISSEATEIQDAFLVGFRTYLRKPEMELKAQTGVYDENILGAITGPDEVDATKVERAEGQGKLIRSDEKGLYEVWELWLRYDVDEDGEEDDIVICFHRGSKTVLRAIYNPLFMGFRPFVALRFYPSEFAFDGMGTCEILEKMAIEVDEIHNMRLDRLEQINAPMYLASRAAGFDENDNPFNIAPGYVRYVDGDLEKAVREMPFKDQYASTYQDEGILKGDMGEAVGVTPTVLGQSVSERPVARDTMALIEEANKKFKFGIDNIRYDFSEIGWMALEMFAQYQPRLSYYDADAATGGLQEKTIEFPMDYLRDGVSVELMASSEQSNMQTRRENDLTIYQVMTDFSTKTAGMVINAANPQMPPPVREYLIEVAKSGTWMTRRIVEDFGVKYADKAVPDAAPILQKLQETSMMMLPPGGMGGAPPPGAMGGEVPPGPPGVQGGAPPQAPPISEQELAAFVQGSKEF